MRHDSPSPKQRKFVPTLLCHTDSRQHGKLIDSYCAKDMKSKKLWYREFLKALEDGYSFANVRQVHIYRVTTQMFRKQIEVFFRVKIANSKKFTQEARDELVGRLLDRLGWQMTEGELETMCKDANEPMTQLAKKLLNTLWGKFGQKEYSTVEYVNSDVWWKLMEMHSTRQIEIESYEVTRPGECRVRWKNCDLPNSYMRPSSKRAAKLCEKTDRLNVAIASAVTSNARLRLLAAIDAVGDRFLYCDTDSVYYVHTPGFKLEGVEQGNLMGEWEPDGDGLEFVCWAKKSYSLTGGKNPKMRAKGITLTYRNSHVISHQVMVDQLHAFVAGDPLPPLKPVNDYLNGSRTRRNIICGHASPSSCFNPF